MAGLFGDWTAPATQPAQPYPFAPQAVAQPQPAPQPPPGPFGNSPARVVAAKPEDMKGTEQERAAFVLAYLRDPQNPHGIAMQLFGQRPLFGQHVGTQWPREDWFKEACDKLIEEYGEEYFLPSKAQIARELYNAARSNAWDTEAQLKYYKLYCEVMDYVKGGAGVTVNQTNNTQTNVMLVRDVGSDEDWEEKTAAQQAKLVQAA